MLLVVKNWKCYPGRGQSNTPDSKVHGDNTGPTWGRQDPGGPHVGHVNLAMWDGSFTRISMKIYLRIRGTGTNGNYYWLVAYVITLCQLFRLPIALNFQLSSPHLQRAHFFQSVVHSSVVTKWLRIVCINYSQGNFDEIMLAHWTKPPTEDVSHFITICPTISIQILNLNDVL